MLWYHINNWKLLTIVGWEVFPIHIHKRRKIYKLMLTHLNHSFLDQTSILRKEKMNGSVTFLVDKTVNGLRVMEQ